MRRKLIIGERIMYVDAETPLNCVFAVKIRGNFTMERLRTALNKIQQKHPLLRSRIKEDVTGLPFFVSCNSLSEIPVRLVERSADGDWKVESKKEWHKLFDNQYLPMARVVWIKGLEEVSELLLICPHCICDGTTMITLLSELLLLLDQPEKVLPAYLPFSSIQELLAEHSSYSQAKIARTKFFAFLARLFFFFKSRGAVAEQGESYAIHWKLDAEKTTAFAAACKSAGVTVHAALCVIFLEAFQQVKKEKAHGKVICPVDIRRFVPEIRQDTMFAFAPIAELSIANFKKLDFWEKALKLKEELDVKIAAMKIPELLAMSEYFHASVSKMLKYLRSTEGTHDLTLSNMGRLPIAELYESFEVETIYSPTVAFPWRNANTIVISTFKGEMDFAFCSNQAFLNEEEAVAIRKETMALIEKEILLQEVNNSGLASCFL